MIEVQPSDARIGPVEKEHPSFKVLHTGLLSISAHRKIILHTERENVQRPKFSSQSYGENELCPEKNTQKRKRRPAVLAGQKSFLSAGKGLCLGLLGNTLSSRARDKKAMFI